jgi:hypothetical protein
LRERRDPLSAKKGAKKKNEIFYERERERDPLSAAADHKKIKN